MMLKYLYIGNIRVPAYGLMIIWGLVVCNLVAQLLMKHDFIEMKRFYGMEFVLGIGAIVGAKLISILSRYIAGEHILLTVDVFMEAGYSFYGGLAGVLLVGFLFCKVFHVIESDFIKSYLFLLPLLHSIWKSGCFMGGCCFGVPYDGRLSVCYAEGINRMSGTRLFPVQFLESIISLLQVILLIVIRKDKLKWNPVGTYLLTYAISRFLVEYLRYHESHSIFSDGQVYSIVAGFIGMVLIIYDCRRKINNE